MNCESFLTFLYEVPLPQWTPQQQASADAHCASCENCAAQLQQQQQLFTAFENMALPEPSLEIQLEFKPEPQIRSSWLDSLPRGLSNSIALFLCAGSALQLFRESGFSWYWVADGRRVESVINLLFQSPLLSVALTLVGLVYCLTRTPQEISRPPGQP